MAPSRSRAYRLKRKESPAKGVRRVAVGRAEHAVEQLCDGESDPAKAVHTARKDTKKLRSVLRLVRDSLGDSRYRRENDRFRDAARNLADLCMHHSASGHPSTSRGGSGMRRDMAFSGSRSMRTHTRLVQSDTGRLPKRRSSSSRTEFRGAPRRFGSRSRPPALLSRSAC